MNRFLKRTTRIVDGLLDATGKDRLRRGPTYLIDEWTAVVDLVGRDGNVVRRLKADRHTGSISRESQSAVDQP